MQQRTVVCSAVINKKITDFSNDFFFQTNRQEKSKLSDNTIQFERHIIIRLDDIKQTVPMAAETVLW